MSPKIADSLCSRSAITMLGASDPMAISKDGCREAFAAIPAAVYNLFNQARHLNRRELFNRHPTGDMGTDSHLMAIEAKP